MPAVEIALWRPSFVQNRDWHEKPNEPIDQLDKALAQAKTPWTNSSAAVKVFLAPEYLFTGAQSGHFMTEHQYYGVLFGLKYLSTKYPDILIIPGSIGWYKTTTPSTLCNNADDGRTTRNPLSAQVQPQNVPVRDYPFFLTSMLGFNPNTQNIQQIEAMVPAQCKAEVFMQAEYNAQVIDRLRSFSQKYQQNNNLAVYKLALNTSPVLLGGGIIHSYNKRVESTDTPTDIPIDYDSVFFCPGTNSPVFTTGGVTFGLEICVDHGYGTLRNHIVTAQINPVDIHLLASAWTDYFFYNVAGSFFAHASTNATYAGVFGKDLSRFGQETALEDSYGLTTVDSNHRVNFDAGSVSFYNVNV
ncbi:MAG: hypothetical protein HRT35_37980 [Algicola sp.]|nr:hypothetical protein [Algicola sp.]